MLIFGVAGCSPSGRHVNWEYVIPDGYTGYLAIHFDCPNGVPLPIKGDTCRIVFAEDGTFCTSDKFFASWSNSERALTKSGKSVAVFHPPAPLPAKYGIIDVDAPIDIGGHTVENPGPDMVLLTYWVGNMSAVNASWPQFPAGKDKFLKTSGVIPPDATELQPASRATTNEEITGDRLMNRRQLERLTAGYDSAVKVDCYGILMWSGSFIRCILPQFQPSAITQRQKVKCGRVK